MNITYTTKSLRNNKFFNFIIVIQLICVFISLYNLIYFNNKVDYFSKKIEKIYENKLVYRFSFNDEGFPNAITNSNDLIKFFNSSNNDYLITTTAPAIIPTELFNGFDNFKYTNNIYYSTNNKKYTYLNSLCVNNTALSAYKITIDSGRLFMNNEFTDDLDTLPVILGNDYKNFFKVGDTFKYYLFNEFKEAKVIGILEKNQTIPLSFNNDDIDIGAEFNPNYSSIDDLIIFPLNPTNKLCTQYEIPQNSLFYNFFLFNKNIDAISKNNILRNSEEIIESLSNSNYCKKSFDIEITLELNKNKEYRDTFLICLTISIVFSTITIILSMINLINKRKKEFGIYIFSGAQKIDLILMIFIQLISLTFLSLIIAAIIMKIYFKFFEVDSFWLQAPNLVTRKLDYLILFKVLLIGTIFSILTSIIPINKILKLDVCELLRRDD